MRQQDPVLQAFLPPLRMKQDQSQIAQSGPGFSTLSKNVHHIRIQKSIKFVSSIIRDFNESLNHAILSDHQLASTDTKNHQKSLHLGTSRGGPPTIKGETGEFSEISNQFLGSFNHWLRPEVCDFCEPKLETNKKYANKH